MDREDTMTISGFAALAPLVWGAAYWLVVLALTRDRRRPADAPASGAEATDERFRTAA
jgi:hypothetical protein